MRVDSVVPDWLPRLLQDGRERARDRIDYVGAQADCRNHRTRYGLPMLEPVVLTVFYISRRMPMELQLRGLRTFWPQWRLARKMLMNVFRAGCSSPLAIRCCKRSGGIQGGQHE